jgi:hypothetical protein
MNLTGSWQDSSDGGSALLQGRYLKRTEQTQKKREQTYMSGVEFETTISVFKRAKTFLD